MCKVLDVNPSQFFEEPRPAPKPKIFRRDDLLAKRSTHIDGTAENAIVSDGEISVSLLTIPAGVTVRGHFHSMRRSEFIYVGCGAVSVAFEGGYEVLDRGDCIYLTDVMPTQWKNEGGDETELIVMW
jgi:uncharacterized RmlC-like cupin family protein